MIFKSYILEKDLNKIKNCKIFLFYGENEGLKQDFKKLIKNNSKNVEILRLFQEEILKNKNILFNEINNKSLFDEKKIVFIDQANDKIIDSIEEISEKIENEEVFIFADILDKKSKLRSYFEKSKNFGVSACYQDNEITIKNIIAKKLEGYQGLNQQILNFIVENTGLNRGRINNEISKIMSFFQNKKIDPEKMQTLLNLRTNEDFNNLRDEALNGNKKKTNKLLADTVFEKENNVYYLNSINQRIHKLYEISNLKKGKDNIENIINGLKPPIFWKDKPIIINQSIKWNENKISKALETTYDVEIKLKTNSSIRKDLLIKNLIVELCSEANAS